MGVSFVLLAEGAASDILADEGGKTRPPELGSDELTGFQVTRLTGGCMIVTTLDNGFAEIPLWGNIDIVLVG